ncbi:MAG: hypothetical protein JW783_08285 [Bacteroidales bacterium]|nr:hypothetical protein [Bacteroidales bacterium]MBN2749939.1 hypothetical protein [Bacteroidales bacterium]
MLVNLPLTRDNASKIPTLKYRLYLAELADVDIENWPAPVKATISEDVLLVGKTYKYLDCKINSINPNAGPGESPLTGKLTLSPIIDGITPDSLSWLYTNMGNDVIAVWERCQDGQQFIGGSPCSGGLKIKLTSVGTLDGGMLGISLTLEGGDCPEPFYFYNGPLTVAEDPVPQT